MSTDPLAQPHRVLRNDDYIPFCGVPFFVPGEKLLECYHGKDGNVEAKRKYKKKNRWMFQVYFFYVLYRKMNGMFLFSQGQQRFSKRLFYQVYALHRMSH